MGVPTGSRTETVMGVSAIGLGLSMATIRHALATLLVASGLFGFFYGPPLTAQLHQAALDRCNRITGSAYRNFRLEWHTTTLSTVRPPHWVCYDLRDPEDVGTSLGWWVDL
jgi:hypothetical protein